MGEIVHPAPTASWETRGYWETDHDRFDQIRLKYTPQGYHYPDHTAAAYDVFDTGGWPDLWKKYRIGQNL